MPRKILELQSTCYEGQIGREKAEGERWGRGVREGEREEGKVEGEGGERGGKSRGGRGR